MQILNQFWNWFVANPDTFTAIFGSAWFLNSVLTPLFRKIPAKNILIVLRFLVGIFDKIQPDNFASHADNAKNAATDKSAGKSASIETLRDQGDVGANLRADEITKDESK